MTSSFTIVGHKATVQIMNKSNTCRSRAKGHRTEATQYNMLGGCNIIHRRKGKQALYKKPVAGNSQPKLKAEPSNPNQPN